MLYVSTYPGRVTNAWLANVASCYTTHLHMRRQSVLVSYHVTIDTNTRLLCFEHEPRRSHSECLNQVVNGRPVLKISSDRQNAYLSHTPCRPSRFCPAHTAQYGLLCAVTTPACQNPHQPGRLTCAFHSGMENTYNTTTHWGGGTSSSGQDSLANTRR